MGACANISYALLSISTFCVIDLLNLGDEFIMGAALLIVNTCAGLAGPIGINRLLRFLETNGEGATAKPWVWILWLFVAPIVSSVSLQWYIFVAVRLLTSCAGIYRLIFVVSRPEQCFKQRLS